MVDLGSFPIEDVRRCFDPKLLSDEKSPDDLLVPSASSLEPR